MIDLATHIDILYIFTQKFQNIYIMEWLNKQLGSLALKMTGYVLATVLLIFGITGYLELRMAYNTAVAEAQVEAESAMETAIRAIDWRLQNVEQTTHTAGKLGSMIGSNTYDVYRYLTSIVESNPDIATAGLFIKPGLYPGYEGMFAPAVSRNFNTGEIIMADVSDAEHGYNYLEDDENWDGALKGDSVWSDPYVDSTFTKRPLVTYSIPLHDNKGNFMGALYTEIDLQWLWLLLNDVKPVAESSVSAIDRDGLFLCHPDSSFVLKVNALELAVRSTDTTVLNITRRMMNGEFGKDSLLNGSSTNRNDDDDDDVSDDIEASYVYFGPVKRTGWSITFTYPQSKVVEIPAKMFHNMMILGLCTLLLLFIAVTIGIFRIARPFAENLESVTSSKAVIERDLQVASAIQLGMLPKLYPAFPDRKELDIYGFLKPAKSVGGDLYDYFIRDEKLIFCIGDVSGKGVPASLFMAVIRALFRNVSLHTADPAEIVSALNTAISDGNEQNMFCTMFVGVLDLKTGHLDYCNAGHNAPIIRRLNDEGSVDVHFTTPQVNLAVGVFDGFPFMTEETVLKPGEAIFMYTDGVTEAENVRKNLFGDEAAIDALADARAHNVRTAKDFVEFVYNKVKEYANGAEQSDDITMVVVEYKGPDPDIA